MTSALQVSIDRTSLSLATLVLPGSRDGSGMHLVAYSPPALQARTAYMPDAPGIHGSEAVSWSWQQALLSFNVKMTAATETALRANYLALVAAISQFPSFTVTTILSGAAAEVWTANPGSIQLVDPAGRTPGDVHNLNPVYAVTIPVYPIPGGP
jgi:hypothetical protein